MAGARRCWHGPPLGISRPVSRVLSGDGFAHRATAISLGRRLPGASSNLPGRPDRGNRVPGQSGRATPAVPIRSCSRRGLPSRFRRHKRGALLPHRFTLALSPLRACGGLLSVALSLGFAAPARGFSRRTLSGTACPWSPDFPLGRPFGIGPEWPSGRLTRGPGAFRVKPRTQ